jgi:hypothetical protein
MTARNPKTCQYASCMETCENGVAITLRTPTFDGDTKAEFCCASHAAVALYRLGKDRGEPVAEIPRRWKVS